MSYWSSHVCASDLSRSKWFYWAGRSAEAAGDSQAANAYSTRSSGFGDAFYGQLATERLGKPLAAPVQLSAVTVPMTDRATFYNREIVRAAQFLGQAGDHEDQRSEEHTSELQSLMSITYAVFCLQKNTKQPKQYINKHEHETIKVNVKNQV